MKHMKCQGFTNNKKVCNSFWLIMITEQKDIDFNYLGYSIPKGWKIYWNVPATDMDPKVFPDAENFGTSRFERAGPIPFSYISFERGPRMCLGKEFARLEILVFIHNVVKDFRWKLLIPNETIEYDPMPTPIEGLPILLQPSEDIT
ncbi:hypothetical protein R3W88_034049 [Solanum pinnatisectum]|uniref:Cytochrome P450 n=1 Tax=Solanum pinnatisectum TaxID=50273 RepID=A0AAV9JZ84_9SOLN|nr:hypothetical protein R3W88_034049 [Solanum pinnatisectum]